MAYVFRAYMGTAPNTLRYSFGERLSDDEEAPVSVSLTCAVVHFFASAQVQGTKWTTAQVQERKRLLP